MVNKVRGEVDLELNGQSYTLCLGLGALAEIETAFGVDSFEQALVFDKPKATDLLKFMRSLLAGNGVPNDSPAYRDVLRMTLPDMMAFITNLMGASGFLASVEQVKGDASPLAEVTAGEPG